MSARTSLKGRRNGFSIIVDIYIDTDSDTIDFVELREIDDRIEVVEVTHSVAVGRIRYKRYIADGFVPIETM